MADVTNLTDNAKVKAHLSITSTTDDTLITTLCKSFSAFLQTIMQKQIAPAVISNEMHSGDDTGTIMPLFKFPIKTFTKLEERGGIGDDNWNEIDSDDYEVDNDLGIIEFAIPHPGRKNIRVSYTAGLTTVPDDLEGIATRLVAREYLRRQSGGASQESLAEASLSWGNLMDDVDKAVIASHKRKLI